MRASGWADTANGVPTLRDALIRRSWMPAQAIVAFFDPTRLLAVAIVLALAWSVYRSPEDRGWHDQLAGTRIVGATDVVRWLKNRRGGSYFLRFRTSR